MQEEPDAADTSASPHLWRSAARTIFYAVLIAALLHWRQHGSSAAAAMVTGLLLGDFMTWLIRSVPLLFTETFHGAWQTAVNVVAAVILYRVGDLTVPRETEEIGVCFLAFLLVLALKTAYYSLEWATDLEDN